MQDIISLTILGFVQGLTEFLPVSSTGHLILAREFFGFGGSFGLAEDAVLHLATALAVLMYFRADIFALLWGVFSAIRARVWNREVTLVSALIIGTLPAVVAGVWFESAIETVFRGSAVVALGLIIGSMFFLAAEYVTTRVVERKQITVGRGLLIGVFQALALIPGMSRSGMVISGGMLLGLSRVEAARFGFLLSFPVILGAGGLKFFELSLSGALPTLGVPLLCGAAAAFLSGTLAIHTLISFLKTNTLLPFVVYRLVLAALIFIFVL